MVCRYQSKLWGIGDECIWPVLTRGLHVERSAQPPAVPTLPGMPAPSFAARPVWGLRGHASEEPPMAQKQVGSW